MMKEETKARIRAINKYWADKDGDYVGIVGPDEIEIGGQFGFNDVLDMLCALREIRRIEDE